MKSLKLFIVLGMILGSCQAFGQANVALTVIEGQKGRALLNHIIESNLEARRFFATTLGISGGTLNAMDPDDPFWCS